VSPPVTASWDRRAASTEAAVFSERRRADPRRGEGAPHLLRESLRNLETRLDPRRFACVHRSAIVNVACVKQLRRRTHGEYAFLLEDGTELKLSRTHHDPLRLVLGTR